MPTLESRPAETVDAQRDQFESQVDRVAEQYDARAEGKAGIQKAMDWGRQFVNGGYGDDQFKNIGQTQQAIDQLRADVQAGRLDPGQGAQQLSALQQRFEGKSSDVLKAQEHNATLGGVVHDTTRAALVGLGGVLGAGSGAAAGLGVASVPGAVVGGAAGATAAANAFDAVSEGLQQADKKLLGNGVAGADAVGPPIAPELDTKRSAAGLLANAAAGEKIEAKDLVRAGVGSTVDAVSGGFAGQGVVASQGAIAAVQGTGQIASRTAVAQAVAGASVKTGVQQSAATLGVQTTGTAIDPALSSKEKQEQIGSQIKDTVTNLPAQVALTAFGSAAGAAVQPANKALDASAQLLIDGASGLGKASVGNAVSGRGFNVSGEQLAQLAVGSGGGTLADATPGSGNSPVVKTHHDVGDALTQAQVLPQPSAADWQALLGPHKQGDLEQTLQQGNIERSTRPLDERAGSIVMQETGSGDPAMRLGAAEDVSADEVIDFFDREFGVPGTAVQTAEERAVATWLWQESAAKAVLTNPQGEIVGAAAAGLQDGVGQIDRVAVAESLRGQGLGRQLVESLEQQLAQQGAQQVQVWPAVGGPVSESSLKSIYEKLGYEEPYAGAGVLQKDLGGGQPADSDTTRGSVGAMRAGDPFDPIDGYEDAEDLSYMSSADVAKSFADNAYEDRSFKWTGLDDPNNPGSVVTLLMRGGQARPEPPLEASRPDAASTQPPAMVEDDEPLEMAPRADQEEPAIDLAAFGLTREPIDAVAQQPTPWNSWAEPVAGPGALFLPQPAPLGRGEQAAQRVVAASNRMWQTSTDHVLHQASVLAKAAVGVATGVAAGSVVAAGTVGLVNLTPEVASKPVENFEQAQQALTQMQADPAWVRDHYAMGWFNAPGHLIRDNLDADRPTYFRVVPLDVYEQFEKAAGRREGDGWDGRVLAEETIDGVTEQVELRPPYRARKVVQSSYSSDPLDPFTALKKTTVSILGPEEGLHTSLSLTARAGAKPEHRPSETTLHVTVDPRQLTKIDEIDIRQQNTSMLSVLSATVVPVAWSQPRFERLQQIDDGWIEKFSENSDYFQLLPTSYYDTTGYRNRETIAAPVQGRGLGEWYGRERATAFHETGAMFRLFTVGGEKADGTDYAVSLRMYFELQQYEFDWRAQVANSQRSPRATFNPLNIAGADVAVELHTQNLVPNMNRSFTDQVSDSAVERWNELFGAPSVDPASIPSQVRPRDESPQ